VPAVSQHRSQQEEQSRKVCTSGFVAILQLRTLCGRAPQDIRESKNKSPSIINIGITWLQVGALWTYTPLGLAGVFLNENKLL
jgi:hypothetical protein